MYRRQASVVIQDTDAVRRAVLGTLDYCSQILFNTSRDDFPVPEAENILIKVLDELEPLPWRLEGVSTYFGHGLEWEAYLSRPQDETDERTDFIKLSCYHGRITAMQQVITQFSVEYTPTAPLALIMHVFHQEFTPV